MKVEINYTPNSQFKLTRSKDAAGYDLPANINEAVFITPGTKSVLIPTGIKIHIDNVNVAAFIYPRSGKGHKDGLVLGNGTGVIDSDYMGELMVSVCVRLGHEPVTILPGDKIAQLVFMPVIHPDFVPVNEFTNTSERGEGGFGSTDNK